MLRYVCLGLYDEENEEFLAAKALERLRFLINSVKYDDFIHEESLDSFFQTG